MHIVKVVYGNDRGGILSCETQYVEILKRRGVSVHLVIVGDGASNQRYRQLGVDVSYIEGIDVRFNGGPIKRIIKLIQALFFGLKNAAKLKKAFDGIPISGVIYRREAFMFLSAILAKKLYTACYWHMANTVNNWTSRKL